MEDMDEEHVDPRDRGKTTLPMEHEMDGPTWGGVFDPIPTPLDDRNVVLGLPAFSHPPEEDPVIIPAGDEEEELAETTLPPVEEDEEPEMDGPTWGRAFDPVPAPLDDHNVVLGLPAFFHPPEEDEEEELADVVHADEDVGRYDMDGKSNNESEGNDDDNEAAGNNNGLVVVARELTFLGQPARFASCGQGTAGFMRLAAAEAVAAAAPGHQEAAGGVIAVHYRYYRFSRPRSGAPGVDTPNYRTDLHHVRYVVPFAADPASSLRLVGASLAADVYPYRSNAQLQALWSGMLAAAPVRVPPRATELVVTVDVGVLRSEDRTPEHMECMRSVLEKKAREVDASPPTDYGQEQLLPAPVRCDGGDVDLGEAVPRPAKRQRFDDEVVREEVCAICQDVLEEGSSLAAWPRCAHVFHGKCLEQLLATVRHRCPVCRRTLSINYMFDH